ncbi:GLPGLI family protein [Elizabethkingia anophelis]|uniref:GLPGLI family protein n=1 Tax=Elizabethkingia anophelis TaxID=1117645 RepID=UPI0004E2C857|nr:GLPGLI family protein [Elizabethkingia anophelis]KFC36203.1 hypothetical protein FF18_02140 [Elizabethkingia anophelis]MCT3787351.1 GLPGLI family protein [Elizabethkingia anophelis]MDV3501598.1 GLPGLI family protein [Elizabethkingia anophelis]
MKYIFLIFSLFFFTMQAQTHRFIYEIHIKKDSTSTERLKDNYIVDVNPDNVYYYNYSFYVADSMQKLNSNEGFPVPRDLNLYMHPSKKDKYVHYEMMGFNIFKMEQTDKQDWKLHTENKTFQGYNLQKATARWGGRNWTVWFAADIPFQEGPYKFHGLPGMIVEIEDDKGNFKFVLVKYNRIKDTQNLDIFNFMGSKAVPITREKYVKLKLDFYSDPLMEVNNGKLDLSKTQALVLEDGTMVTKDNLKEVTEKQRKIIKKYNNPIEQDKAIRYE